MYQSKSTPRLSLPNSIKTNINEPQFDSYMYDDNSEHWDGTYATANDEPYQKAHHSPKQYRDNGTLISSDSQFLRNSLEKRADAFENVLDNAMHRTVLRRQARERENEYLLEVPPIHAQLKLRGLPRSKRQLFHMVQQLRTIRSESERRIDDLNRAIVLHRSTTRRQATRIAVLEKEVEDRKQAEKEFRNQVAAAKGKLWKMTTGVTLKKEKMKDLNDTKQQMIKSLEKQEQKMEERFKTIEINFTDQVKKETMVQLTKHDTNVTRRIKETLAEALHARDQMQLDKEEAANKEKQNMTHQLEKNMNQAISAALRKQKEWMMKEEEKILDGVQKTEAHLLADMKANHLEMQAAELAAINSSNDKLVAELKRELIEEKKCARKEKKRIEDRVEKKMKRLEATHEKEMNEIVHQQSNIEMLKMKEKMCEKKIDELEMENVLLKSEIVELRNGFDGYGGGDMYGGAGYDGDENDEDDMNSLMLSLNLDASSYL